jgi:hypothetical protein
MSELLNAALGSYLAFTMIVLMFKMSEGTTLQRAMGPAICWPLLFAIEGKRYIGEVFREKKN